ncbi:MAG: hypothetical protein U9N14_00635 [Pseudomonadota bacterium]|nr:hypothetical protein [Pseudomonadota bacterium]
MIRPDAADLARFRHRLTGQADALLLVEMTMAAESFAAHHMPAETQRDLNRIAGRAETVQCALDGLTGGILTRESTPATAAVVAKLCHDLRGGLNIVVTYAGLIREEAVPMTSALTDILISIEQTARSLSERIGPLIDAQIYPDRSDTIAPEDMDHALVRDLTANAPDIAKAIHGRSVCLLSTDAQMIAGTRAALSLAGGRLTVRTDPAAGIDVDLLLVDLFLPPNGGLAAISHPDLANIARRWILAPAAIVPPTDGNARFGYDGWLQRPVFPARLATVFAPVFGK